MGSFSMTCSLSSLPIGAGDQVRYLLLTEKARSGDRFDPPFFARTIPIRAIYNDYGSVEGYAEGLSTRLILEGLKQDMIEVGVGDNSVHDVATSNDMSFKDLLTALWEERIIIAKHNFLRKKLTPEQVADWQDKDPDDHLVPHIRNVSRILSAAGYSINEGRAGGFLVDELDSGIIRVREARYTKTEGLLQTASKALSQFATVITAGSGSYADAEEILVLPKPGLRANGHTLRRHSRDANEEIPQRIFQAMVREDVWQALLKMSPYQDYWGELKPRDYKLSNILKAAIDKFEKEVNVSLDPTNLESLLRALKRESGMVTDPIGIFLRPGYQGVDPGAHWNLLVALLRSGAKFPEKEVVQFIADVVEMRHVVHIMAGLRKQWFPTSSLGPQGPESKPHRQFFKALSGARRKCPKFKGPDLSKVKISLPPDPGPKSP